MKISKKQKGGYVAQRDNTRVSQPIIKEKVRLTQEQLQRIQQRKLQELSKRNQAYIYDADKAKYYKNLQDLYNYNAFGYGLQGRPTRFDPSTPEGQQAISSTFNYARGNALDFLANVSSVDSDIITPDMLKYASQHYVPDTNMDNNMYQFFSGIKDWDAAAQYLSKHSLKNGGKL